ncbi:MAG: hypothetical protein LDL22_10050, partial [Hyphomicrobiales bacterium]|nr:hypothetical protein [Hyphomicrobiales bacterium]
VQSLRRGNIMPPRLKTLESHANAAGGAFAFAESDFEIRYHPPARPGRTVMLLVALAGMFGVLAHHLGWTSLVATLSGWRAGA